MSILKKLCLALIYLGLGIALATPLLLDSGFFYPFITSKAFVFRIVVQVMLLAFLVLQAVSPQFRPKLARNYLLLLAFVLWTFFVSILAGNFYHSFWGDMERSEGLLLWLHLLAFALVIGSVMRERKLWHVYLDISIGVAWLLGLFGLGQFFKVESLLATSGSRVDATIGNPAFLAAYMLFNLAFAVYLYIQRRNPFVKAYYAVSALLFAWTVFASQTRGAVVGLLFGLIVAAGCLLFSRATSAEVRRFAIVAVVAIALSAGFVFTLRNSALVGNSNILQRLTSISLADRTVENRLVTWQAAWSGWREKFITGHGLENFGQVFDKRFPPVVYQKEGSQIWFDRAHNLILDRGVTTGIVGLVLFLAFLLHPAWQFLKNLRAAEPGKALPAAIFLGFIAAYFIQDLFVFESLTTYIILIFTWVFFTTTQAEQRPVMLAGWPYVWTALAILALIWIVPIVYVTTWHPATANRAAAAAMRYDPQTDDFFEAVERFKIPLEATTYGREEFRVQFIEFIDAQLSNKGQVIPQVLPVLEYADNEIELQLASAPKNAKYYLLAMRHYNYTFASDTGKRKQRLEKALSFFPKLAELSPTRPQVYQEAGYSHLYLYRDFKDAGQAEAASAELRQAEELFNRAVDLNPKVPESYVNLIMLYLNAGDDAKLQATLDLMDERGVQYKTFNHLGKLRSLAVSNSRVRWIGYFSQLQVELNPTDADAWINLAVYYATTGDRAKAIEAAEQIRALGPEYSQQADLFIQNVQSGAYEKR